MTALMGYEPTSRSVDHLSIGELPLYGAETKQVLNEL